MAASYTKFLLDIQDTQVTVNQGGSLPECAPWYHHGHAAPGDPAWTTAYVNFVYWMHWYYGDVRAVETHYSNLKQFMAAMEGELNATTGILPASYSIHGDWDGIYDVAQCKHISSLINTYVWAHQV